MYNDTPARTDGLILGNEDITDDAQEQLRQDLLAQEMFRMFPTLVENPNFK